MFKLETIVEIHDKVITMSAAHGAQAICWHSNKKNVNINKSLLSGFHEILPALVQKQSFVLHFILLVDYEELVSKLKFIDVMSKLLPIYDCKLCVFTMQNIEEETCSEYFIDFNEPDMIMEIDNLQTIDFKCHYVKILAGDLSSQSAISCFERCYINPNKSYYSCLPDYIVIEFNRHPPIVIIRDNNFITIESFE